MTEKQVDILLLEDDPRYAELILGTLDAASFHPRVDVVDSPAAFRKQLDQAAYHLIISDYDLETRSDLDTLEILKNTGKDIPVILISGSPGEETAVECVKRGATDYILKDRVARLAAAIERALEEKKARDERKRREQQLQQSQRMEVIAQLVGGIAHAFNNLLTLVNGYSQLMLENLKSDDPLRRYAAEIENAGERAASLTRQLMAFGRRQVMAVRVLDLNSLIRNTNNKLRKILGEEAEFVTRLGPDLGKVEADPNQMEQILINLAANSRDAMPEGGRFTIETANVWLDESEARAHGAIPGSYVLLKVSDSGAGMSPETQAHIFDPFFTTKGFGKGGAGLGLAVVYGVVKQLGGHLSVSSKLEDGAIFHIYLPQVESVSGKTSACRPAPEGLQSTGSETILLVEDEEGVRTLAMGILREHGYDVLPSTSAENAIEVARQKDVIHLLLTDAVMPGMTGQKLAEYFASVRPGMKVIYMSGYTDAGVAGPQPETGVAFIQKPFSPKKLVSTVREVLDSAPAVRGTRETRVDSV